MNVRLLVDASEFVDALASDMSEAVETAFVQAMTFEGDAAGMAVAELIRGCPARDRRVLVDGFTRHVLSDRLRWLPRNLLSPEVWREARATRRMFAEPAGAGRLGAPRQPGGAVLPPLPRPQPQEARGARRARRLRRRDQLQRPQLRLARPHDPHRGRARGELPRAGLPRHLGGPRPRGLAAAARARRPRARRTPQRGRLRRGPRPRGAGARGGLPRVSLRHRPLPARAAAGRPARRAGADRDPGDATTSRWSGRLSRTRRSARRSSCASTPGA